MNPLREILERHLKISTICMLTVIAALPLLCIWVYLSCAPSSMKWFLIGWLFTFITALILRYILIKCPFCGTSIQNLADYYRPSLFTLNPRIKCCPYCRTGLEKSVNELDEESLKGFRKKNILEKIILLCMFFAIIIAAISALYLNLLQKHGIDKANYNAIMTLIEKGKYIETVKCISQYEGNLKSGESPGEALKKLGKDLSKELKNTENRQ